MLPAAGVVRQKPAWAERSGLKDSDRARTILAALHAGEQEVIRPTRFFCPLPTPCARYAFALHGMARRAKDVHYR
jgi:hypothetical protein